MEEQNPVQNAAKPKRRWFQFNLKTLMLLPVIVGLPLGFYLYWDDWRKHRPPLQIYEQKQYQTAIDRFVADLVQNRPEQAYTSTSAQFKKQVSFDQFQATISRFPTCHDRPARSARATVFVGIFPITTLRNWTYNRVMLEGSDKKIIQLDAWVVMDDSFFYRRPPLPKVEEFQIREICEWDGENRNVTALKASWEKE